MSKPSTMNVLLLSIAALGLLEGRAHASPPETEPTSETETPPPAGADAFAPLPGLEPEPAPTPAPAPSELPSVRVVVDAAALGPDREYFETEIARRYAEALTAEGFEVGERGSSTVRVKLDYFDQRDRDFLIATDVVHDGRMAVSQRPAKCPSCLDDELIAASMAMLPELVDALRSDPAQVPSEPEPVVTTDPADDPPEVVPVDRVAPIGPLGGVGIGVAAIGLGLVIGGAVELSRGVVYDPSDFNDPSISGVDHTPRGQALLGVGIASVVVGGGLLAADLVIRSKRRASAHTRFTPAFSGQFVGLRWSGHF